jgi:DNA-binding CsgD family transcriptional regulator
MKPLTGFVQTIYDAAVEPDCWTKLLRRLAEAVDGELPGLAGTPGATEPIIPDAEGRFLETWGDYFTRFEMQYQCFSSLRVGEVSTGWDMLGEREYYRNEYYADWLQPQRLRHCLTSKIWASESAMGGLGVFRASHKPNFGPVEKRFLSELMPHLQQAIGFGWRIAALDAERRALAGLLDALPMAVILLDGGGVLRGTNREADRLLATGDGMAADREGLRAASPEETGALRRLTLQAAATGNGNGDSAGGVLTLRRPSGRRPLQVFVTPLGRDTASTWHPHRPAAAVFVSDPEAASPPPAARFAGAYGLTAAQANVAVGLAEGKALDEIADQAGVQVNTVRAHLKEIFAKTATRRQSELVRLLLRGTVVLGQE